MKKTQAFFFLLIMVISSGCATYHISTESLVQQVIDSKPENKNLQFYTYPLFLTFSVSGNSLEKLKVLDKDGQEVNLPITNHTSIRITRKNGKKKTFYCNTLLIKDSTITGKLDHIIGTNIKPINLNDITKIELQRH